MKCMMIIALLLASPVAAQQIYKCQKPDGTTMIQQMPCTPTGGGETMTVKPIPQGAGSGLSDDAKAYMADRDKHWEDKAKADKEERDRQETLDVERAKARAEAAQAAAQREQAAAQRETARAIWGTGGR